MTVMVTYTDDGQENFTPVSSVKTEGPFFVVTIQYTNERVYIPASNVFKIHVTVN